MASVNELRTEMDGQSGDLVVGQPNGTAGPHHARLARLARRALRCRCVVVWERIGDFHYPKVVSDEGEFLGCDSDAVSLPPCLIPGCLGVAVTFEDLRHVEGIDQCPELATLQASSYLGLNLRCGGGSVVFLSAFGEPSRKFQPDDVDLVRELCDGLELKRGWSGGETTDRTSLEALGRLVGLGPTGLYIFDIKEMKPTYVNQAVFLELGYSPEQVLALEDRALAVLMHPEDLTRFPAHVESLMSLRDGERSRFEFRLRDAHGRYHWFLAQGSVLRRDEDGRPREILSSAMNITDWKKATELLHEAGRQFEQLAEISPVGIFRSNMKGECLYLNRRGAEISGLDFDTATPDGWMRAIHPDDADRMRREWWGAVENLAPFRAEYRFLLPNGKTNWVLGLAVPEFSADGKPTGYLGTVTDITALKAAEEDRVAERRRYQLATEAAFGICYEIDLATGKVIVNEERVRQLLGYPAEEFEPTIAWWLSRVEPNDAQLFTTEAESLERERRDHYRLDYRIKHADGSYRWVSDRGFQYRDAAGRPATRVGCVLDITEQKRSQRDIEQKNRRLGILSDTVRHLLTSDRPNEFLALVFDELAPDLQLDYYFNFVVTPDGSRLRLDSHRGIDNNTAKAFEYLDFGACACGYVAYDRSPLVLNAAQIAIDPRMVPVAPLKITAYACFPLLAGERLVGTLAFCSSRRKAFAPEEIELIRAVCNQAGLAMERLELLNESRRQAEMLRENDRRKDEFLAMLAHELRNPLAAIRNAAQLLGMPHLPTEDFEWSRDVISRQVGHLSRMIDDLLDVSRITRGKIRLRKEVVDLRQLIARATEATRLPMEAKSQSLKIKPGSAPLYILGDATRLEQILVNLIDNASKYSDRGDEIELDASSDEDGTAVVKIKDHGIGIKEEMLPRIFDLFTQVDKSLNRSEGGLGIGLALVKRLAQMHGGTIQAFSPGLGEGSEFVLRLPTTPAPSGTQAPVEESESGSRSRGDARAIKILVVDDNIDLANGWSKILSSVGFRTVIAHDGPGAITVARLERPDVIILDIGLPGLNGYEVAECLLSDNRMAGVLFIAATGYGQAESVERSTKAGFRHHMTKPVNVPALIDIINNHVAKGKSA